MRTGDRKNSASDIFFAEAVIRLIARADRDGHHREVGFWHKPRTQARPVHLRIGVHIVSSD